MGGMREYIHFTTRVMNSRNAAPAGRMISLCILLVALFTADAFAVGNGILRGRVYDYQTQKPVPNALIAIQGTTKSVLADKNGVFQIELPAGKYGISILKEEFYNTCYQDVEIESGKITTYKCELVAGDPKQQFFFAIGGITVLDRKDILPQKIETTHEISSAEIEHYLSTNLGDIMDLVPGVERTKSPGLSKMTQLDLRGTAEMTGTEQTAARFGTKIIIDDIPISNNANMQTGTGAGYGSTVQAYAATGLDLRTIPADNIQNVEVVTGVPSVEYGDLTTGLVKVRTKIGSQPTRLKLKSNPDTKEANVNGGLSLFETGISYSVNYAWSERNIRLKGDEYSRYNGQLNFSNKLLDNRLNILNKFYYTGVLDEYDLTGSDPLGRIQSNKDKTLIYGHAIDFKPTKDTKIEWAANVNYTKRDAYSRSLVGSDVRVLSASMEPGTHEGVFDAGAFISQIWTRGEEWSVGAKLNMRADLSLLHLNHSLLAGGEYSYDDNVGQGKIFNPLKPPYGDLGYRPLSFDAVPALQSATMYLEDNINGFLFMRPYDLNFGFRYEMYTPEKLHLDGLFNEKGVVESRNGTFLNPRVRLKYEPFDGTQIRFGWGKSSKMPAISNIYQGPQYVDIVERNISPPDSVPLVTTYVYNFDTSHLLGNQEEKTELSFDQKVGPVGFILTGFTASAKNLPREEDLPAVLYRYEWTNWPSAEGRSKIDSFYLETPGKAYYRYAGMYRKYGVEFQLVTKRIEKISTSFRIASSYVRSRSGGEGLYMSTPKTVTALHRTIYPYYYYTEGWGQKLLVDYNVDWLIKKLGMWVTLYVQQTLYDWDKGYIDPILYSPMYYDPIEGRMVYLTPAESDAIGLSRSYDRCELITDKRPNNRYLFNVNVSKSIGRGAEISFFVQNVFDSSALYENCYGNFSIRNPNIFYGVEFSTILDDLWRRTSNGGEG
jgi:outer membrane receptor protein involved in Fe transport